MRIPSLIAVIALTGLIQSVRLQAIPPPPPLLEQVPIDRLVTNLQKWIASEPANAALRVNLARSHAMAYASKSDVFQTNTLNPRDGVWIKLDPDYRQVPFEPVKPTSDPAVAQRARVHLEAAIAEYEAALAIDPTLVTARLGYGWCLQQAGERERAVAAYRAVVADTVARKFLGVTVEAADYLIPLLDANRDAEEITRLRGYRAELERLPRAVSPIVIPLGSRHAVDALVDHDARVRFDADGSALDGEWTWITRDAGWLVLDRKGTGAIDSAIQLFGNVTFWMFWENGYHALRALDDNQDGALTGDELTGLAIWRDANANGVSEHGEVKQLAQWGIVSVSCRFASEDESDVYIASSKRGVTFADGTTRPTFDVQLHRREGSLAR